MFGHHRLESSRGNERVIFEDVLQMISTKKKNLKQIFQVQRETCRTWSVRQSVERAGSGPVLHSSLDVV